MGYYTASREVQYAGKERERNISNGLAKLDLTMQWLLVGYGHAYWQSVLWTIVLTLLGAWIAGFDTVANQMNLFERLLFSFDRFVPILRLSEDNYKNDRSRLATTSTFIRFWDLS